MSASPDIRVTPEEYLALERVADRKSELINGRIYAMAGASREHVRITTNLAVLLGQQLWGKSCEVFNNDLRVGVPGTDLYTYPDLTVACGELVWFDEQRDTLLNPRVIAEVLSPSTEAYDRGDKFAHYRRLESLSDYLIVSQDRMRVEHYTRREPGQWLLVEASGPSAKVTIASIGCSLSLADLYARVEFPGEGLGSADP